MSPRNRFSASLSDAGVAAFGRAGTTRAQRYVVAGHEYRPFTGLPEWLATRSEDHKFLADICEMEHDVHVHKVFDITEPALIEHRHGYVFLRSGLNLESMTYWELDEGPPPKAFRDYLSWRAGNDSIAFFPQVVSLRARWEGNFWHFHDNVLSKLMVVDNLGIADGIPLLVGKALWHSRFFSQIRALPGFRERNWVLHDRPVRTDRTIICLEGSFRLANMNYAHKTLTDGSADEPSPGSTASQSARSQPLLFLSRREGLERHLDNERDLADHLVPEGFAMLDAEQLCLEDRREIFRHARCVVLPQGAGLANLVHRIGGSAGVVEILPGDKRLHQPYGAWLCRELGFAYRAVVGSPLTPRGSFTVDVAKVMSAVRAVSREQSGPNVAAPRLAPTPVRSG